MSRSFSHLPLVVRIPLLAAVMTFVIAIGTSQLAMFGGKRSGDALFERMLETHLDGMAAGVRPHLTSGDDDALRRALLLLIGEARGLPTRQILVFNADGELQAHVARPGVSAETPTEAPRSAYGTGIDLSADAAWIWRALEEDGRRIGVIEAELFIGAIAGERQFARLGGIAVDLLLSALLSLGVFLMIRRLLQPMATLADGIGSVERGELTGIPDRELPPQDTEFGRLLRAFNRMVVAVRERIQLDARLAAQERAALLGRIAATVAHEVRNPLGGMATAVDTARRFRDDPRAVDQSLNVIERGLETLGNVVEATLATYRETGAGRRLGPADFEDLEVLVEPEARRRQLALEWRFSVEEELPISATEVRQVLLNLLLNACAATPPGGRVAFSAAVEGDALVVEIVDEGPGLPEEIQRTLQRGDEAPEGPGIGVDVVMRLVKSLNGRVMVSSRPDTGTALRLVLPFEQPDQDGDAA